MEQLAEKVLAGDHSASNRIISVAGRNLDNSAPFWKAQMGNVRRFGEFRQVAMRGDIAAYFVTGSIAELHLTALRRLLKVHVRDNLGPVALELFMSDFQYRRKIINQNLHIVAAYFDARTCNYFNSVLVVLHQLDDAWWRYEGAESRGAIHFHMVGHSAKHHLKVVQAHKDGHLAAASPPHCSLASPARTRRRTSCRCCSTSRTPIGGACR